MAYSLEQFSADIRHVLKADPGPAGKKKVCELVSRALKDADFIARHLTAAPIGNFLDAGTGIRSSRPGSASAREGMRVDLPNTCDLRFSLV